MKEEYRKASGPIWPIVLLVIVVLAFVTGAAIFAMLFFNKAPTTHSDTDKIEQTTLPDTDGTEPESGKNTEVWSTVALSENEIHKGNLILVNYANEYQFPENDTQAVLYGNKPSCYKLRNSTLTLQQEALTAFNALMQDYYEQTGDGDIIVISTFRDFDSQKDTYSDYVNKQGIEAAQKYVAQPGYSEHHTGLALDLSVYHDDGTSEAIQNLARYSDFLTIAARHGFILRYESNKYDITRISGEEWHFRYVGTPHAYFMKSKGLCFEEYIDLLRGYSYENQHLIFTDEQNQNWEIYYYAVSPYQKSVSLPVPTDAPFTVSGNNVDGFIVTVQR